ncbi:hypothetical protein PSTT_03845, partial [Puccinia striiformis]
MSVDAGGKVSVGGLDKTTDSGSLQSTFGQFGEVSELDFSWFICFGVVPPSDCLPAYLVPLFPAEAVGTSAVSFEVHPRASSHSLTIYEHTAVMQDHNTGESRGFGFVTFKQEADAHSAVQALDGQQLDGRKILVNFDRTQNGGGGGGGQRHGKNAFYDGYAYGEDGTAGKQK